MEGGEGTWEHGGICQATDAQAWGEYEAFKEGAQHRAPECAGGVVLWETVYMWGTGQLEYGAGWVTGPGQGKLSNPGCWRQATQEG